MRCFVLLVLAALLPACSDDAPQQATGSGGAGGSDACAPGKLQLEDGSCVPGDPYPCEPGELALDGGGCLAAGTQQDGCPAGQLNDGAGCRPAGLVPGRCNPHADGGCDPILPATPCSDGEMALPGDTTCRPVADCGIGTWGNIPIDSTTVFVDAAYTGGNDDGSQNAPFTALNAAITSANSGDLIAIAAGMYTAGSTGISKPLRLWGRCPSMVTVSGTLTNQPALWVDGQDGTEIRGIAVTGSGWGLAIIGAQDVIVEQVRVHDTAHDGFNSWDGGAVTLRDSLIDGTGSTGVFMYAADMVVESTAIRDIEPNPDNGWHGIGAMAYRADEDGTRARLEMRDSLIDATHWAGAAGVGSDVVIEHTVIQNVAPDFQGKRGIGVEMVANEMRGEAATLQLSSSVIAACSHAAVSMWGTDGAVEGTAMREVSAAAVPGGGSGLVVSASPSGLGGQARIAGSLVSNAIEGGIWLIGGSLDVDGVWVQDSRALSGYGPGQGLTLTPGSLPSVATVHSSRFDRNGEAGVVAFGGELTLLATIVDGTDVNADSGAFGDGVIVTRADGAPGMATVAGCVVSQSMRSGVTTFGSELTLIGTDLVCNPIAINGGDEDGEAYALINGGGNRCGCDEVENCRVLTPSLSPPAPLQPALEPF